MTKPKLIIDPGHGGKDPGGGSSIFYDPTGFYEKTMVLDISLYQYARFQELGMPVTITRTTDVYLSPEERTRLVRESGASHCISNHINAEGSAAARGVETIHSIYSAGSLALVLLEAIVLEGVPKRRMFSKAGSNGKDYYFMHRLTGAVETVIVEYGFATNPEDADLLQENWKVYAEAVIKAYCNYIGHPYSRKEAVALPNKKTMFMDVEAGRWSEDEIVLAVEKGIMRGYPDGTFKPQQPVTREELAAAIANLLKKWEIRPIE